MPKKPYIVDLTSEQRARNPMPNPPACSSDAGSGLKGGKALVDRCQGQPLGSTAIRDMFRTLEAAAGVEHQTGRSFYGLRRQVTDLAPEFVQDARVLNRLTGHLDSATRERVYPDPWNEVFRARAAQARRRMRQHLGNGQAA